MSTTRRHELIPELPREREFDEAWWGAARPTRRSSRRHADGPTRPIWRFVLATLLILVGVVTLALSWWTHGH
ncbi:MAG TPA: hypothetical protein VI076_07590 [Actinopolymorphaceae bacterium]